ncbi:MAG: hypothetical protein PHN75_18840 [Syntrophales bacterium]|nr:hypothetical protein [Syntrophales bacterium]
MKNSATDNTISDSGVRSTACFVWESVKDGEIKRSQTKGDPRRRAGSSCTAASPKQKVLDVRFFSGFT